MLSVTQKDPMRAVGGSNHPEFNCPVGNWTSTWIKLSVRQIAGSLWKVKECLQMEWGSLCIHEGIHRICFPIQDISR